jgi:hypothetical protein
LCKNLDFEFALGWFSSDCAQFCLVTNPFAARRSQILPIAIGAAWHLATAASADPPGGTRLASRGSIKRRVVRPGIYPRRGGIDGLMGRDGAT